METPAVAPSFMTFRNELLTYLRDEKAYIEDDIRANQALTDDVKEERGMLIRGAVIEHREGTEYSVSVSINNSKLRPGDQVRLKGSHTGRSYTGKIIENNTFRIDLSCPKDLSVHETYRLETIEQVMLDTFITLLEGLEDGSIGAGFLRLLAGMAEPQECGLGNIDVKRVQHLLPTRLNAPQAEACLRALQRPSIYAIQGPPGTGKTDVLSTIARIFHSCGRDVLIISNTHQAVNNALNQIVPVGEVDSLVVKVGEKLKTEGLDEAIVRVRSYKEYATLRKKRKKNLRKGDVVGMTLHAAITSLGLRNQGFCPSIILVDEAGQIPLVEASCIGAFGCGSLILIGDDRQMPPIFHEKQRADSFSTSIFSYACQRWPHLVTRLNVTYRMNQEITELVSRNFYEPFGLALQASSFSANRHLAVECNVPNPLIRNLLSSKASILTAVASTDNTCEDMNPEEAKFAVELVKATLDNGLSPSDVAVITPYRRQVRVLREWASMMLTDTSSLPLFDTVERLQGQDVKMIVISFCVSSANYLRENSSFLFAPNRLNVMISRAKMKVVLLGSSHVLQVLNNILRLHE